MSLGQGHLVVQSQKPSLAHIYTDYLEGKKEISAHVKILSICDYGSYYIVHISTVRVLLSVHLSHEVLLLLIWLLWEENDL